jgi:hypothetical protein
VSFSEEQDKQSITYHHITIMINRWRAQDESRHVRSDLLPAIMLHHLSLPIFPRSLGIPHPSFLRENELGVGDTCWPDLKRFAHELVLSIDLYDNIQLHRVRGIEKIRTSP